MGYLNYNLEKVASAVTGGIEKESAMRGLAAISKVGGGNRAFRRLMNDMAAGKPGTSAAVRRLTANNPNGILGTHTTDSTFFRAADAGKHLQQTLKFKGGLLNPRIPKSQQFVQPHTARAMYGHIVH
jgi:hypothetical protein